MPAVPTELMLWVEGLYGEEAVILSGDNSSLGGTALHKHL